MKAVVFDNIIFSLQQSGGISKVWCDLLCGVAPHLREYAVLEYAGAKDNRMRQATAIEPPHTPEYRRFHPQLERMLDAAYRYPCDHVFHSSYYRLSPIPGAKNVTTVHDFINERYNHGIKSRMHSAMKRRAIIGASAVVCISEATRNDLLHFVPEAREKEISVIGNAISDDFRPDDNIIPDMQDALLFVGSRKGYKNFRLAAEAAALAGMRLCACGKPLSHKEQKMLESLLPGRWTAYVYPDNKQLNRLYNSVFCLIYPSSCEGFGLPVAEAQKAGCPAVALRGSSIPEISGNAPTLVDRSEAKAYANMIHMLKSPRFRTEAIEQGICQHKRYTTETFCRSYLDLYSTL